jgi:hypothetical protein
MLMDIQRHAQLVSVATTDNRGFTPEELASRCAGKIVSVADSAPPAIKEQALAFKAHIEFLLVRYMREAVANDRATVYNALKDAGHPELAELIRRL